MFGLSFEKIVIVGIIAAIILGPRRLPHYAEKLGEMVRLLRAQAEAARTRAAETVGAEDWQALDPRQYDPRRIIRDALDAPNPEPAEAAGSYVITGSSGHPRRRFIAHADESSTGDDERAVEHSETGR
ncbi:MAG: twin-arginine translocase TatA/TatE family subunit [Brevibacterium sp.]|uniref:twin-arginine translocase TatA/TatE family subunit n=1 Tax=Brevibacterium sp. TaxID=1701 RepID=UPI003F917835